VLRACSILYHMLILRTLLIVVAGCCNSSVWFHVIRACVWPTTAAVRVMDGYWAGQREVSTDCYTVQCPIINNKIYPPIVQCPIINSKFYRALDTASNPFGARGRADLLNPSSQTAGWPPLQTALHGAHSRGRGRAAGGLSQTATLPHQTDAAPPNREPTRCRALKRPGGPQQGPSAPTPAAPPARPTAEERRRRPSSGGWGTRASARRLRRGPDCHLGRRG